MSDPAEPRMYAIVVKGPLLRFTANVLSYYASRAKDTVVIFSHNKPMMKVVHRIASSFVRPMVTGICGCNGRTSARHRHVHPHRSCSHAQARNWEKKKRRVGGGYLVGAPRGMWCV